MKAHLIALAVLAVGCTHSTRLTSPVPADGKPVAPVAVEVELKETEAHLALTFESPGTNVAVKVWGLDGLTVAGSGTLLVEGTVKKGETREFDVTFSRGEGRSHLVVGVDGDFQGAQLRRVATFAIGTPTAQQLQQPGQVVNPGTPDAAKVLPAQ